jgi:hypothetical protein
MDAKPATTIEVIHVQTTDHAPTRRRPAKRRATREQDRRIDRRAQDRELRALVAETHPTAVRFA